MARPRTTGPNIQFRLPAELHEIAEELAGTDTVHAWARDLVEAALRGDKIVLNIPRQHGHALTGEQRDALAILAGLAGSSCTHAAATKEVGKATGATFYHCPTCGATRIGITGTWGQP